MSISMIAVFRPFRFPLSMLCVALMMAGCATPPPAASTEPEKPVRLMRTHAQPAPSADEQPESEVPKRGRTLLEQRGSGQFVTPQGTGGGSAGQGGMVNVNFENAPLTDVLAAILGDMLKVPYSLEGEVGGNITLVSSTPVPESALLDMLESLLDAQGIAMVRGSNGIYRVGAAAQLRKDVPVSARTAASRGYSVQIIPLKYLSANEALKILEPLGLKDAVLRADPVRNILMLAASGPQMQNAMRTLQTFDVDVLKGMSFGIYELLNLDPQLVVERFGALLSTPELEAVASSVKLLPMAEINSVMVIAPQAGQLSTVGDWIRRFDQVGVDDSAPGSKMYVYSVQNGEAAVLAGLLGQLFGADSSGSGKANASTSGSIAPGLGQSELSSSEGSGSDSGSSLGSSAGFGSRGAGKGRGGAASAAAVTQDGSRIVADESTNSLLIMADPKEWRSMRSALEKIDKTPAQVLVEVSIWEVTLSDELNYGVEWFFNKQTGGDGTVGGGRLSLDNSVNRIGTGFSYIFTGNDWRSVINLLSSKSNVKSLSSPSVLVLDNREASIQVGTQQPISTGTTSFPTSGTPTTTENFTLKDTGVQLKVRPRVNAGGLVIMDIKQEVTDLGGTADPVTGQMPFLKRSIESSVAIQSGDTIILGGLIQDSSRKGDAGIPYLHSLPVVGPLFGYKNNQGARTELLVTISPRAINRYKDFDRIGEEFRDKLKGITGAFREEFRE